MRNDHPAIAANVSGGSAADSERCQAIDELVTPGLEALAAECKADGSTPAEFSLRALAIHKAKLPSALQEPVSADKQRWLADAELREEFGGNEAAWLAYSDGVRNGRIHGFAPASPVLPPAQSPDEDRQRWLADADIRAEFGNSEAAWLAYAEWERKREGAR